MVDLPTLLSAGVLATFVPLYAGILSPRVLSMFRKGPRARVFLAAASAGIIFWSFLDAMLDAAQLDVNQGFRTPDPTRTASHVALALLFAVGLFVLIFMEKRSGPKESSQHPDSGTGLQLTFAVAAIAALAIGYHAFAEGLDIGASLPNSASILDAIGGVLPGVAYILHKFLEGFVVGVFALLATSTSIRRLGTLGLVSGLPTLIGFFLGLPAIAEPSYFFAMGAAGAVYIEIKLLPIVFKTRLEYLSILALLLGFYSMYVAGLFHG